MRVVTFTNRGVDLAGHLHLPDPFDESENHAALVCVHPGSSVKEQTAGIYAAEMARRGFIALAFDASFQGASGGEPRHLEDPAVRVEDIRCAVDFLVTQGFVDERRIGVLGVCAGGGYAVNAALTERRISAVGVVAPINNGRARRQGDGTPGTTERLLDETARMRTAEARGGEAAVQQWIPETPEAAREAGIVSGDVAEAVDYFRTPRGQHPNSVNRLRSISNAWVVGFDAFHQVESLLTQPLQVVVGDRVGSFGSYRDGYELFRRAPGQRDIMVIEGAGHYDLYDRPDCVEAAADRLAGFYANQLPVRPGGRLSAYRVVRRGPGQKAVAVAAVEQPAARAPRRRRPPPPLPVDHDPEGRAGVRPHSQRPPTSCGPPAATGSRAGTPIASDSS